VPSPDHLRRHSLTSVRFNQAARLGLKNVHVLNRLYFLTAMFKSRDHDPTQTAPLSCRFKYPDREVPPGSAPFERLQDDTCLQNSAPPWASLQVSVSTALQLNVSEEVTRDV